MDAKQYLEQLAQSAGLTDEVRTGLLKAAEDQKFAKSLEEGVMLRSDYSRNLDQLAKDKANNQDWYNRLAKWEADKTAEYQQYDAILRGQQVIQPVQGDFISKKDFDEFQKKLNETSQQREVNFINVTKQVARLASRHAAKFGEELDTDALEKIVVEKNVPVTQAYDLMVADRVKQQQEASLAERIKQERAEAVREFASTRQIPIDSAPRDNSMGRLNLTPDKNTAAEHVPFEGRLTPTGYSQLRNSFVEEWNKAGGTGGT